MSTTITENFSENKRGRGRPRKYTLFDGREARNLFPEAEALSRRSIINQELEVKVSCVLGLNQRPGSKELEQALKKYHWLYPFSPAGNRKQGKTTILYELGRLKDDEAIILLADHICEHQMNAKEAVALIKHNKNEWRSGGWDV